MKSQKWRNLLELECSGLHGLGFGSWWVEDFPHPWHWLPTPSSAEVKERVVLYLSSSWALMATFIVCHNNSVIYFTSSPSLLSIKVSCCCFAIWWTLCTLFTVPPLCINYMHVVHTFSVICWVHCSNLVETPTLVQVLLSHYRNGLVLVAEPALRCAQHITWQEEGRRGRKL